MKRTTISIVIPVYNVEKVVEETLLSVKEQKSSADEVIVIDDGSTDNSFNIINNFKDIEGWKILQTKNQGLGLTRNFGLSVAKSEYIYFLDSDDIIYDNLVEHMRETINQYENPDIILFSGESFFDNNANGKKPNLKFTTHGQFFYGSKLITKLTDRNEILPQASRYITKLKLWTNNDLFYPKGIAEDEAVFFPLLTLSRNTVVIPKIYYKYRVGGPGSITLQSPNPQNAKDFLARINFCIKFMRLKYDLIKFDLSAWKYSLVRKGLNYISMCLKTKTKISWSIVVIIFNETKSFSFPFKLIWRFIKYYLNKLSKKK